MRINTAFILFSLYFPQRTFYDIVLKKLPIVKIINIYFKRYKKSVIRKLVEGNGGGGSTRNPSSHLDKNCTGTM